MDGADGGCEGDDDARLIDRAGEAGLQYAAEVSAIPKGLSLLLLAFLLPPLALYLLVLGWINRRPRPVRIGGPWEFAGVLFALSGFLLVGGPALLASLDERSRWFWLLGESEPTRTAHAASWSPTIWIAFRLLYFVVVAGGSAVILWRCRRLTSFYNVDPRTILAALEQTLGRLGLAVSRSGCTFRIGALSPPAPSKTGVSETDLTPDHPAAKAAPATKLRVDVFAAMRHVTLHWAPADSLLRAAVEQELTCILTEAVPLEPGSLHAALLSLAGVFLLALALVAGGLLVLFRLYPPR